MTDHAKIRRRRFMTLSTAGLVGSSLLPTCGQITRAESKPTGKPWLRKTLKIGMIRSKGSLTDKFRIAMEAGLDGVELTVPGINIVAAKQAVQETGIVIDGTVGGYHWGQRHTDPDPDVRKIALEKLKQGITETGSSAAQPCCLSLVMERMAAMTKSWNAQFAIRAALPLARKRGVHPDRKRMERLLL